MEPIEWILLGVAALSSLFSAVSSSRSNKKQIEAENERIAQQNKLNEEMYQRSLRDNSISSQAQQYRDAGFNLNYVNPSFIPTSQTPQAAGTDSTLAGRASVLSGLGSFLGNMSNMATQTAYTGWSHRLQQQRDKLLQQYREAQLNLAQQKLNEVIRVNNSKIVGYDLSNSILSKKLFYYDDDRKLANNLTAARIKLTNSQRDLSDYRLKYAKDADKYNLNILKNRSGLSDLDYEYQKKYHNTMYSDSYWSDLAAEQAAAISYNRYLREHGYSAKAAKLQVLKAENAGALLQSEQDFRAKHPYYDDTMSVMKMIGTMLGLGGDALDFGTDLYNSGYKAHMRRGMRRNNYGMPF